MYISLVDEGRPVLEQYQANLHATRELILSFRPEQLARPCAEGEWTIKEILVHMMDTERIFCYRALRIARNDLTPLPGFEQDDYVPYSRANEREGEALLAEYAAVRQATLTFFESLDGQAILRAGTVNGNRVSVRALVWMIAGHELHHLNSIRENYLPGI